MDKEKEELKNSLIPILTEYANKLGDRLDTKYWFKDSAGNKLDAKSLNVERIAQQMVFHYADSRTYEELITAGINRLLLIYSIFAQVRGYITKTVIGDDNIKLDNHVQITDWSDSIDIELWFVTPIGVDDFFKTIYVCIKYPPEIFEKMFTEIIDADLISNELTVWVRANLANEKKNPQFKENGISIDEIADKLSHYWPDTIYYK